MELLIRNDTQYAADWLQTVKDLKAEQLLGIPAENIAAYITSDPVEIKERQALIRDCMADSEITDVFRNISDGLEAVKGIAAKSNIYSDSIERTLYEIRTLQLYVECIDMLSELWEKKKDTLHSQRLKSFLSEYAETGKSEKYNQLKEYLKNRLEGVENIKSFTVGVNLSTSLEPREIGIVSMNDYHFSTPNFFQTFLSESKEDIHFVAPLVKFKSQNDLMERSLYVTMNSALCKSLKMANRALEGWLRDICKQLVTAMDDISFICKAVKFPEGMREKSIPCCFAAPSDITSVKRAYNPLLLRKLTASQIICNDIEFDPNGIYMHILTGANSGGKSVFVMLVGITQVLFQLGLPIPAKEGEIKVTSCVFTHFATSDKKGEDESRFVNECIEMRHIINTLPKNAMVLMDETFSATGSAEGAAVAYQVLKHIQAAGCMCVYSTHIHELEHYMAELNKKAETAAPMHVEHLNGRRTFRVIYGASEEQGYAYELAKKYGLEFEE